jgi:hypothetical protein
MRDDYKKYVELSNRAASLNGRPTSDRGLSVSKTQADAMYCHRFVSLEILSTNAVFYVSVNVCMHYTLLCGDAGSQFLNRITSYASSTSVKSVNLGERIAVLWEGLLKEQPLRRS